MQWRANPQDELPRMLPAGSIAAIQDDAAAVNTYVVATDKRGPKRCGARFQCRKRSCFDRDELIPEGHSIRRIQRARVQSRQAGCLHGDLHVKWSLSKTV